MVKRRRVEESKSRRVGPAFPAPEPRPPAPVPFRLSPFASRLSPLRPGRLVVRAGPSGVGTGTVGEAAALVKSETAARLRRSISVTTRAPRPGEQEGVHYFFHTPEQFAQLAENGKLLEWASYLEESYGTPKEWVDRQLSAGYDVILEIEVKGALQVRRRHPEAVLIYMLPPSWEELRGRLAARGSDDEETQQRRIQVACEEITYVQQYDYVIINDVVETAAQRLLGILEAERWRVKRLVDSD